MERKRDLIMLSLGAIFTVLGGFVAQNFQHFFWQKQHEIQLRDERRQEASKVLDSVSRLMDKWLYCARSLYDTSLVVTDSTFPAEIYSRLSAFRQTEQELQLNRNRYRVLLQVYFDQDASSFFSTFDEVFASTDQVSVKEIETSRSLNNSRKMRHKPYDSAYLKRLQTALSEIKELNASTQQLIDKSSEINYEFQKSLARQIYQDRFIEH